MFPSISSIEIQKPIVETETEESAYFFQNAAIVRQCPIEAENTRVKENWDKLVVGALEIAQNVNPFQSDLPVGSVISSLESVGWSVGNRQCDIRPRLIDKSSGRARLIDSGSQISIVAKEPGDKIDNSFKLVAVNGSRIDTYGVREITVKIGRKAYSMPAVVCDIDQDILGMDFITRYRLNFEWDEYSLNCFW